MKKFFEKIYIRNFKKIPYFFNSKPKIFLEQNNYALIGRLSTSLLHDILTPLTSLHLSFQVSSQEKLKPIIDHSTTQISEYIAILRDFMTHESDMRPIYINEEIKKCLTLLRHNAIAQGVQLQYIESAQIKYKVHPLHIYQIIINLISNAIEASISSQNKKVILSIRTSNNYFYIECRDFGTGISKDIIKKIGSYNFSTKSKERGFGLYSVNYIVRDILGGELDIESEAFQGSLFSCKIPLI